MGNQYCKFCIIEFTIVATDCYMYVLCILRVALLELHLVIKIYYACI